jgi:acyl carrier protein
MIPSVIMPLPTLTLSPNAKVNRRALPLPEWGQRRLKSPFVAPRNPLERAVASLWSEILGLKQIGVADDFFAELGGHSLMATRLVSRIRGMFGVEFPLRLFFESPTVAASAEAIERLRVQGGELTTAIRPVRRERKTVRVVDGLVEPREVDDPRTA